MVCGARKCGGCQSKKDIGQNFSVAGLHVGDPGGAGLDDVVGEVDEELGEAPLGRGIVAQDRGEGGVAEWVREALAQSLAGASIVTESAARVGAIRILPPTFRAGEVGGPGGGYY